MHQSLEKAAEFSRNLHRAVATVVVGLDAAVDGITIAVLARGHALLEGVPGTAKTLMANAVARALGLQFTRIQFTPDLMPSDIVGTNVFDIKSGEFRLVRGPIFSQLILGDEINRAPPKTQAAMLEAMQERQVSIDGITHPLPGTFTVLATQNPIENEGTYPLPEAQLDRFLLKIPVGYPSPEEEDEILRRYAGDVRAADLGLQSIAPIIAADELTMLCDAVGNVHVEESLRHYVRAIVRATRDSPWIMLGAGPRAGVHLLTTSRWRAALSGRDFITPEDVRDVLDMSLAHRLIMTAEAELDGLSPHDALASIVQSLEVPR
jgi:MoxR-like ATPase